MPALDCFVHVLCQNLAPKLCVAQSKQPVVLLLLLSLVHGVRHVLLGGHLSA